MSDQTKKLNFVKRFYDPKEMFLKRKYTWWQIALFVFLFAMITTIGSYIFLSRPSYYRQAISNSLENYTKETSDPEFQKAVSSAKFKDGKFIYSGKKRIKKKSNFDLGINLTASEMKKDKPNFGLVFTKEKIVLYAKNPRAKNYDLEQIDFSYDPNFDVKSKNLKSEVEKSWFSANTKAYLSSIPPTWFFGFIYRFLLVWLLFILIIHYIIKKTNHRDESMLNLFGFMANASLIPAILMSVVGAFYFDPLVLSMILVAVLLVDIFLVWFQTKFSDEKA